VKQFTEAIHKAAADAAVHMTANLRASALEHGWDSDVVSHIRVNYGEGKFSLDVHPEYKDRAFVHEYGNEQVRPTAVLRKFEHQVSGSSKIFNQRFSKHLGVK
jgi:hypothetical protein